MKKEKEYIELYYDLPFKNLFGTENNIKYTTDMLEELLKLEKGELEGSKIQNSVVLNKETVKNKAFELDIVVKTPKEDIINIEMQKIYNKDAEIKNFMYVTGLFYSELKRSEKYKEAKKVTQINFTKELKEHKNNKIIKNYYMTNEEDIDDKILKELFRVIIVDIDQKSEKSYNNDRFEKWRKLMGAHTLEEAKEIADKDPIIEEALEEMIKFMGKDYVQDYTEQEKLIASQMDSMKEEGKYEGLQEGIKQGIKQGQKQEKIEIAKNMIINNENPEKIKLYTGLSIEDIKNIKENI